jgi:hypothetical protein
MSWSIVKEVEPIAGEIIVDKAGKGAALVSDFFMILQNLGRHSPHPMWDHNRCLCSYDHAAGQ